MSRTLAIVCIAVAIEALGAGRRPVRLTPTQTVIENMVGVATLRTDGKRGLCCGLCLDDSTVLTHRATLDGALSAMVIFADSTIVPVTLVTADNFTADLIIVRIPFGKHRTSIPIACDAPSAGMAASMVIFDPKQRHGPHACSIAGVRDRPGGVRMLQMTCVSVHEMLGSPVISDSGAVIGMIVTTGTSPEQTFAVDLSQFDALFRGAAPRTFDAWNARVIHRIASDAGDVSVQEAGYYEDDTNRMGVMAWEKYTQCRALEKEGKWRDAYYSCRTALLLEQRRSDAWLAGSEAAEKIDRMPEAILMLDNAARLHPERKQWEHLGVLAAHNKQPFRAVQAWREILALDSTDALAWGNLGTMCGQMAMDSEALAAFATAQRFHPGDANVVFNRAQYYRLRNRDSLAEHELRSAIAMNPNMNEAWESLGQLLISKFRFDDAIPVYAELTKRVASSGEYWNSYGGLLQQVRRAHEAVEPLRKAIALIPEDVKPHRNLALAYAQLNQPTNMMNEWKALLRIDPGSVEGHYAYGSGLFLLFHDLVGAREEYEVLKSLHADKAAQDLLNLIERGK